MVYVSRFGNKDHSNRSIEEEVEAGNVPEHDVLVGGFPCQDYSVASTLRNSGGLQGKKGVLWWSIEAIIAKAKNKPKYLILENVDRLLKSPSGQHGRDFAIMLSSLLKHDYAVEWRVINAADHGMPQKRRRVFILAYLKGTSLYKKAVKDPTGFLKEKGVLAQAFPATFPHIGELEVSNNEVEMTNEFNKENKRIRFENSGVMVNGNVFTSKCTVHKEPIKPLRSILDETEVPEDFYIDGMEDRWERAKSFKKTERTTPEGFTYYYRVGSMLFPDDLDQAARTIVT